MTISNTARTAGPYAGTGVNTTFPFAFKVFARSDLLVARTVTATGVESILVLDVDYTVNLSTNQNSSPGGIITLAAALPVGTTLAATSNLPIQQSLELTNQGGFYPTVINDALDRIVITIQQLSAKVGAGALNVGAAATLAAVLAGLSNTVGAFSDYAALRTYVGTQKSIYVAGYLATTAPIGIAGTFVRDPNDTTSADNGGTIIVAVNGVRWKRQYSEVIEVDWFGAFSTFGVTDSKPAIAAAIAAAMAAPKGTYIGFRAGATYKMLSGLTWNSTLVGFRGRGATLDCSLFTNQILLQPTQAYGLDANERTGAAQMHPVEDLRLRGPGFALPAVGLLVDAPADDVVNAGLTLRRVVFQGWATEIVQRRGAFFCTYEQCVFQGIIGAGTDTTFGISIEAATNSGETTEFIGCLFGGRNFIFKQENGNADTFFKGCRFDYVGNTIMQVTGGKVSIIGGHTEGSSDAARWYQVSGADTHLTVIGAHTLVISGPKSNYAPFYSDDSCTNGGISIRDMNCVFGGNPVTTRLIDGNGRTKTDNISYGVGSSHPLISSFQNQLSYPSFENANYVADWALTGTHPPARTNAVTAQSGTYSLEFAPVVGDAVQPTAVVSVPCLPGQFGVIEFWYLTINLAGTGGTFFATNYYADKNGNVVGVAQQLMAVTSNVGVWSKVTASIPTAAPAGTHNYAILFNIFGTASGTPKGYIDSVSTTNG